MTPVPFVANSMNEFSAKVIHKFRTLRASASANLGRTRQEMQPIRNRAATTHDGEGSSKRALTRNRDRAVEVIGPADHVQSVEAERQRGDLVL